MQDYSRAEKAEESDRFGKRKAHILYPGWYYSQSCLNPVLDEIIGCCVRRGHTDGEKTRRIEWCCMLGKPLDPSSASSESSSSSSPMSTTNFLNTNAVTVSTYVEKGAGKGGAYTQYFRHAPFENMSVKEAVSPQSDLNSPRYGQFYPEDQNLPKMEIFAFAPSVLPMAVIVVENRLRWAARNHPKTRNQSALRLSYKASLCSYTTIGETRLQDRTDVQANQQGRRCEGEGPGKACIQGNPGHQCDDGGSKRTQISGSGPPSTTRAWLIGEHFPFGTPLLRR
ncbi:hypothetical protein B0H11DRAFT_1937415 [Mycena galericulata]|nr:hypothetical protein B0H11DRAFT_1937415 [Mycena galericulata]